MPTALLILMRHRRDFASCDLHGGFHAPATLTTEANGAALNEPLEPATKGAPP